MIGGLQRLATGVRMMVGLTPEQRATEDRMWSADGGAWTMSSRAVNADTAATWPVWAACQEALSEPMGSLPVTVEQVRHDGRGRTLYEPMPRHPLASLLNEAPNVDQDRVQFLTWLSNDLSNHGNALCLVVAERGRSIGQLVPVPWTDVARVERRDGGRRWYHYRHPWTGAREAARDDEVWHVTEGPRTSTGRGAALTARGRVDLGRELIAEALSLQEFGNWFFRNAGHGGIITGKWDSINHAREFIKEWRKARSGRNVFQDVAMPEDATYHDVKPNNATAQFLELRRQVALECCQLHGLAPFAVGILEKITFSNVEQLALDQLANCVRPRLGRVTTSAKRWLAPDEPIRLRFDTAPLELVDKSTLSAFAGAMVQWGVMSRNEVRPLLNLGPFDGGDEFERPLNMERIDHSGAAHPRAVARVRVGGETWGRTPAGVLLPGEGIE
ncbi:MAG: phage portal protein [Pseudomonadota bacterium]